MSYEVAYVHIEDKASLESFDALMQACSKISGMMLKISSAIGREGWETLTRALQHQPEMKTMVRISKSVLDEERLEDLNEFLAALRPSVTFCVSSRLSCLGMLIRNEGDPLEANPLRLDLGQIMDMSHDEWDGLFQFDTYDVKGDNEDEEVEDIEEEEVGEEGVEEGEQLEEEAGDAEV